MTGFRLEGLRYFVNLGEVVLRNDGELMQGKWSRSSETETRIGWHVLIASLAYFVPFTLYCPNRISYSTHPQKPDPSIILPSFPSHPTYASQSTSRCFPHRTHYDFFVCLSYFPSLGVDKTQTARGESGRAKLQTHSAALRWRDVVLSSFAS